MMPIIKTERIGMAMASVVIVHSWSHVWDAFPLDVGLMLPPSAVIGGLPSNPTIFPRTRSVCIKRWRGVVGVRPVFVKDAGNTCRKAGIYGSTGCRDDNGGVSRDLASRKFYERRQITNMEEKQSML